MVQLGAVILQLLWMMILLSVYINLETPKGLYLFENSNATDQECGPGNEEEM